MKQPDFLTFRRREIPVRTKILDEAKGLVEYVASDESIDSYREVVRADGWRFTRFRKNAPFVDSHRYDSIDRLLGKVVDFRVEKRRLIETVQWAIDVPGNERAKIGWAMTVGGYLKAVSVGFQPIAAVSRWDSDKGEWMRQLDQLGLQESDGVNAIYTAQEQIELSAVVIGANPNAVARAYKAGLLDDSDLESVARLIVSDNPLPHAASASTETAPAADSPGQAANEARAQAARRRRIMWEIRRLTTKHGG